MNKPSPYDLSTGNKGLPALVKAYKKKLKKDYRKLGHGKQV